MSLSLSIYFVGDAETSNMTIPGLCSIFLQGHVFDLGMGKQEWELFQILRSSRNESLLKMH